MIFLNSIMHQQKFPPKKLEVVCMIHRAVYRIFAKGGRTWSMSKRGGARLFVAAGQPQGVGAGGECAPSCTNFLLI